MRRFYASLLSLVFLSMPATADAQRAASVEGIVRGAMARYHVKAMLVRVTENGRVVYGGALGDSMNGEPATVQMHFRNGAMAFTYMSFLLLQFVDRGKVRLDDKLSKFLPNLPNADRITLKNLANMTSGYADYVYQPEVMHGVYDDPFRHWTSDELIRIGVSKPLQFAPGTNWGYSHTNYVILGRVLEKIAGMPLAAAMQQYVLSPMGLRQTQAFDTPQIPEPVLHAYSSERRAALHVPSSANFYEESTFWDPSWTTAPGAVQTTDIADMARSMEVVGAGTLLSKTSHQAQVVPNLAGLGHADPKCPACRKLTTAFNYGLGVVIFGPWITQTKSFAGSTATVGYLPSHKLTIAVATTYLPAAFDSEGNFKDASVRVFGSLANALAPGTLPPLPKE